MKRIGITMGFIENNARMALNQDYAQAVLAAGCVPLAIPPLEDEVCIYETVRGLDGLVISGGADVDPALYGQAPIPELGELSQARDRYELLVLKAALTHDKPMLCICRGLQLLNVYLGGTLYQDIGTALPGSLFHPDYKRPSQIVHTVNVLPGTLLKHVLGADELGVNSRHHQAAEKLGDGLTPAAYAPDGVLEAAYMPQKRFVLAVQWHPESLQAEFPRHAKLFAALRDAAGTPKDS